MARIVVVDDYLPLLAMLKTLLEAAGHVVMTASDGRAGLDAVRCSLPDLVLLDVDMPLMDGVAVCAALKECEEAVAGVPVLLMSGRLSPEVLARARGAGACGALPKPFCRIALLEEIERVLRQESLRRG